MQSVRNGLDLFYETFNPEDVKGGLWRLILFALVTATFARWLVHPDPVVFPTELGTAEDYWSMIGMSALLIAVDAMLIVFLSWSMLKTWKHVLGVAAFVGATHVVFPLATFLLTAGAKLGAEALGLPLVIAGGVETAIFFIAFVFVTSHLREVLGGVVDADADTIASPDVAGSLWAFIKAVWPAVFGVSIDALMVGPAKIAFMARYTPEQFWMGFVWIGLAVFILVCAAGFIVLALKAWMKSRKRIAWRVHAWDFLGSIGLVGVFVHFSIFAGVYFVYTLVPVEQLLETVTIWGLTGIIGVAYMVLGPLDQVIQASYARAGLAGVSDEAADPAA